MKRSHVLITVLAALFAFVAVSAGSVMAKGVDKGATVTVLDGKAVKATKKKGPWTEVKKLDQLSDQHYLKTGDNSRVELAFTDGSKLRVDQNSMVKMKSLMVGSGGNRQFNVHLQTGKVWATVKKALNGEEGFKVTTENAVAGVRGTIFRVDHNAEQPTVVRVYSGAVAVRNIPVYADPKEVGQPGASANRREVAGPKQITRKQWEELIAKDMQMIQVAADGASLTPPEDFMAESEASDAWVAWNKKLDQAAEH